MKRNPAASRFSILQIGLWGIYGILFTYANRYLVGIGLTDTQAGILLAVATALSFVLQPLLTAVTDRTKLTVRQTILIAATGMLCASALLPLTRGTVWLTAVLYAIACVCLQLLPAFCNALGMAGINAGQRINFGLSRGMGSVSFGLAAQVTNMLITQFGDVSVPIFAAVICVPLVLAAMTFPVGKEEKQTEPASNASDFLRNNGRFMVFLVGTVLLYVGHNCLCNTMYRIAEFKGNANAQGTAMMISAVVELPVMFLFLRMLKVARCDRWLCISGVFFTLRALLTLYLPGVGGLYAAQLVQMLGFGLFAISSVYYVGTIIPERDVVKGQTYLGAANTVGALIAHLCAGALIDRFGVRTLLLVTAAVCALGTVIVFASAQRVNQTVGAPE